MKISGYESPIKYLVEKKYLAKATFHTINYEGGKIVFAEENPQLMLYGYGAVLGLIDDGTLDEDFDDFDAIEVGLHICQPRLNHFDDHTVMVSELIAWAEAEVAPRVKNIANGVETDPLDRQHLSVYYTLTRSMT